MTQTERSFENANNLPTELTALWLAVSQGHVEMAELLLQNGANPNAVSGDLSNCKICIPIIETGNLQVEEERHWKPRTCPGSASRLPVIAAALESDASHTELLHLLRLLLDHGADPEIDNWPVRYVVDKCVDDDSPYFVEEESMRSARYPCMPYSAMEWACCKGDSEYLSIMLDQIIKNQGKYNMGSSLLLCTLESDCATRSVEQLLLSRKDIGLNLEWCWLMAARLGRPKSVRAISDMGVDISASDGDNQTALHLASENMRAGIIIPFLITKGANVHRLDCYGRTPVHVAAKVGNAIALEAFLNEGGYLDNVDREGISPLRYARDAGDLESVKLLLPFWGESDLLVKDRWQMSLLSWVEWLGPSIITNFVECAIGNGDIGTALDSITRAGVENRDSFGKTALIVSTICGDIKMVDQLLRWGSDMNWVDSGRKTALHHACEKGFMGIVCLLLGAQVDAKTRDYERPGLTPWCYAFEHKHTHIIRLLHHWEFTGCREEGAGSPMTLRQWSKRLINVETPDHQRPFHDWPRSEKRYRSLKAAVWSAYQLRRDTFGRTLLHNAAMVGNYPLVVKRLEIGIDPHDQDKLGRTPLHYALTNCNYSVAELLMQNMSNYDARDETGSTAFDYAPIYNNDDNNIQKLLQAKNDLKTPGRIRQQGSRIRDAAA